VYQRILQSSSRNFKVLSLKSNIIQSAVCYVLGILQECFGIENASSSQNEIKILSYNPWCLQTRIRSLELRKVASHLFHSLGRNDEVSEFLSFTECSTSYHEDYQGLLLAVELHPFVFVFFLAFAWEIRVFHLIKFPLEVLIQNGTRQPGFMLLQHILDVFSEHGTYKSFGTSEKSWFLENVGTSLRLSCVIN